MKTNISFLFFWLLFAGTGFAHGVAIKDATLGIYFKMLSTSQEVTVFGQVATIKTTQVFQNLTGSATVIKYAFPLHEEASATSLRWKIDTTWFTAIFTPAPQDTTLPGGGNPVASLLTYLGNTPLFFGVPDTIAPNDSLTVELTYVELLPYSFNVVQFDYPNKYSLIQSTIINHQRLHFVLESQRTIDSIKLTSHTGATITNIGTHAEITYDSYESPANADYQVQYTLNASQLGLYSYSTFLPDSVVVCDSLGGGFFTMIVEPDPDTTQILQKIFTLMIDRSGSMTGSKIQQAKDAAVFIVNHLNPGDQFNIVDFNETSTSFQPDHVVFNATTKAQALTYINAIYAGGSTDIAGAFHTAIQDFAGNDTTVASIIIFLTDGQPTAGLTGTSEILAYIQNQINYYEVQYLMINTFGIGQDVNQQLLSQIASQNNGLCQFLLDNELEEMISAFFLQISNPVLMNIEMTFDPPIIHETYPNPLPNLYLGQQLIVTGRYYEADSVNVTFSGHAFGQIKTYSYSLNLADSLVPDYMFTIKLWAMKKIDYLYVQYFTYPLGSPEADSIQNEIINISICYNVSSPFTGFGVPTGIENPSQIMEKGTVSSFYPNPFTDKTTLRITLEQPLSETICISLFNLQGRLVRTLTLQPGESGIYEVVWDGCDDAGKFLPSGLFLYTIRINDNLLTGKIMKL
ncbi:MAG: VWA domain-containing protein [Bacteroidetes bacterium]|nr:VWA domain-containing protein [Bacteroidota bacterium]